jgi:hypothetical protein
MMACRSFSRLFAAVIAIVNLSVPAHCFNLWPNPDSLPSEIPVGCRAVLSTNITCTDLVSPREIAREVPINPDFLNGFCTAGCKSSLQVRTIRGEIVQQLTRLIELGGKC